MSRVPRSMLRRLTRVGSILLRQPDVLMGNESSLPPDYSKRWPTLGDVIRLQPRTWRNPRGFRAWRVKLSPPRPEEESIARARARISQRREIYPRASFDDASRERKTRACSILGSMRSLVQRNRESKPKGSSERAVLTSNLCDLSRLATGSWGKLFFTNERRESRDFIAASRLKSTRMLTRLRWFRSAQLVNIFILFPVRKNVQQRCTRIVKRRTHLIVDNVVDIKI